jgi:low affinity Fe/Cu permease
MRAVSAAGSEIMASKRRSPATKRSAAKKRQRPAMQGAENRPPATLTDAFARFASHTSHVAGRPGAFLAAVAAVVLWATTGPLFGFSDTWQLIINTSTTIVTFLMVFLIQHTQNRDTLAVQLKLGEIIFVLHDAENRLATAEDLSDKELEELHQMFRQRADQALQSLEQRRAERAA